MKKGDLVYGIEGNVGLDWDDCMYMYVDKDDAIRRVEAIIMETERDNMECVEEGELWADASHDKDNPDYIAIIAYELK